MRNLDLGERQFVRRQLQETFSELGEVLESEIVKTDAQLLHQVGVTRERARCLLLSFEERWKSEDAAVEKRKQLVAMFGPSVGESE